MKLHYFNNETIFVTIIFLGFSGGGGGGPGEICIITFTQETRTH